jgi:quinol monooxygenase YgiN
MSVIIAGTMRAPPENLAALKPHMRTMLTTTRAEDGCVEYSYAVDVTDPGLIHLFEVWRDQGTLDVHIQSAHMAAWRAAGNGLGVSDRRLFAYEIAAERAL